MLPSLAAPKLRRHACFVLLATANATAASQVYTSATPHGLKFRIAGDTTWLEYSNGATRRLILKGDTLIATATYGASDKPSTATWLLGRDSSRLLDGTPPPTMAPMTRTSRVMLEWEMARLRRLIDTGIDGRTYEYNRDATRSFSTRIRGDTVWIERLDGSTDRTVLRADTLFQIRQKAGQDPQSRVWLIRGDSAYLLDRGGKSVMAAPKTVVLAMREVARIDQQMLNLPRPPE